MAYEAKDGKKFGNRQKMQAYDERGKSEPKQESEGGEGSDMSSQDIGEVVAQHGPADKVEIEHDHAAGKHHVTSHHGGKKHHSEHGSAAEAHMHGARAAGVEEQQESPQFEAGEQAGAKEYGGGIPGM